MRASVAKRLRKMARFEMQGQDRELVLARKRGSDIVINEPSTNRAMYLALKGAYNTVRHK